MATVSFQLPGETPETDDIESEEDIFGCSSSRGILEFDPLELSEVKRPSAPILKSHVNGDQDNNDQPPPLENNNNAPNNPAGNPPKRGVLKLKALVERHTKRSRIMKAMGGGGWVGVQGGNNCVASCLAGRSPSDIRTFVAVLQMLIHIINTLVVPYRIFILSEIPDARWQMGEHFLDVVQLLLLFFSFFIPYEHLGEVVSSPKSTSMYYLRNGFLADLPTAFPGSFALYFSSSPLWRIGKLQPFAIHHHFKICSRSSLLLRYVTPYFWIVFSGCYATVVIVHCCSCLWYFLIKLEERTGQYGAFALKIVGEDLFSTNTRFQLYLRGVEWSAKHLIGYGVHATLPQTDGQVVFMLCVAMFGICLYTYLLASVSTFVSHMANCNAADRLRVKLDDVTSRLTKLGIPNDVSQEIKGYYVHVYKVASSVTVDGALGDLPYDLLTRVNFEVSKGILAKMPILCDLKSPKLIEMLVHLMTPKVFLPNLQIVSVGDRGAEMIFVWSGEIEVFNVKGESVRVLRNGDYFGETALLMPVKRLTSLLTLSYCTLFVLDRQAFRQAVKQFPELSDTIKKVGQEELERSQLTDGDSIRLVPSEGSSIRSSIVSSNASSFGDFQNEFFGNVPGEAAVGAFLFESGSSPRSTHSSLSFQGRQSMSSSPGGSSRKSKSRASSMISDRFETSLCSNNNNPNKCKRIRKLPRMLAYRKSNMVSSSSAESISDILEEYT